MTANDETVSLGDVISKVDERCAGGGIAGQYEQLRSVVLYVLFNLG